MLNDMPRRKSQPPTVSLTYRLPADPSRKWERTFLSEEDARSWARDQQVVPTRMDRIQRLHGRGGRGTFVRMSQRF
jgi:hypothetical protein